MELCNEKSVAQESTYKFWKRLVLDQAYKHATVISPADTDRHACMGVSNLWSGLRNELMERNISYCTIVTVAKL